MTDKKLYDINDLAKALGTTQSSISNSLNRRNWEAIPQPFKRGGRNQWLISAVDRWLEQKNTEGYEQKKAPRRGRPRLVRSA